LSVKPIDLHLDLVKKARTGDQLACYQLYQLYSKAMFNICMRMMHTREEAEDLLQEAFTDAFTGLHSFRGESTFGAWLKRIVVNKCINALKKKKVDLVPDENIARFEGIDSTDEKPEFPISTEQVKAGIHQLPDGYRVVLSLYLLEGYDHKEIGQILNISEGTSKSQYLRGKRKLRSMLESNAV